MTFLDLFFHKMETPKPFGTFHLVATFLLLVAAVFLLLIRKRLTDKSVRRILLFFWILILLFEVIKQIRITGSYHDGVVTFDSYHWYIFPYQFCSTPFFVLPFVIFLKDGKVRDSAIAFLCTFAVFAGTMASVAFSETVFCTYTIINVQTLVHHDTMILVGLLLASFYREKLNFKFYLKGLWTFAAVSVVAMILNEILYSIIPAEEVANLFFISPHYPSTLAVIGPLKDVIPYPLFLCVYFLGFAFVAFIIFLLLYYPIRRQFLFLHKKEIAK